MAETADWWLNDVHNSALKAENVHAAFKRAMVQEDVEEGQYGGGAGMTCHMFPGGTGTSSRVVKCKDGNNYTVGILCQTNYGHTHDMQIAGVPVGKLLLQDKKFEEEKTQKTASGKADEGSIVVILM